MEINILVIGQKTKFMVEECIYFPTVKDMKVNQLGERKKVLENIFMKMEMFMKETGLMIRNMVKENITTHSVEKNIMVIGWMEKKKEMEYLHFQLVMLMMDNFQKDLNMEMVKFPIILEEISMEIGQMIKPLEEEIQFILMVIDSKENIQIV